MGTLNGIIKILIDNENNQKHQFEDLQNKEIFFYAPTSLQLQNNDLISFEISYFDDGRPYATKIRIVKYGGVRYTAHIEAITADILRCSVFNDENQSIDVAVNADLCVNAVSDALLHGSQIEFSLFYDERSSTLTAQRIILNKRQKTKSNMNIDVDAMLNDIDLTEDAKVDKDEYLIANNPPDIVWIDDNEQTYKTTKTSINYDRRMYISVPFEVEEKLKSLSKKLTELKPLNQFDRISDDRKENINNLQKECIFLLIRYFCVKIIERRCSVPSFIKLERLYQRYFAQICNEYMQARIDSDEQLFDQFIFRLKEIEFSASNSVKNKEQKQENDEQKNDDLISKKKKKKKKKKKVFYLKKKKKKKKKK